MKSSDYSCLDYKLPRYIRVVEAVGIQKLHHDFLGSQSPNLGKYTVSCTIKWLFSLIYRTARTMNTPK